MRCGGTTATKVRRAPGPRAFCGKRIVRVAGRRRLRIAAAAAAIRAVAALVGAELIEVQVLAKRHQMKVCSLVLQRNCRLSEV